MLADGRAHFQASAAVAIDPSCQSCDSFLGVSLAIEERLLWRIIGAGSRRKLPRRSLQLGVFDMALTTTM
jgi:hypothetical protein